MRRALGLPMRVARLTVPLSDIEQRLAGDVTSGRRDDVREAAASIAAAEGVGVEDVIIRNDRPVGVVARDVMTFLGCCRRPEHSSGPGLSRHRCGMWLYTGRAAALDVVLPAREPGQACSSIRARQGRDCRLP